MIDPDFPPVPPTVEIQNAVKTLLTAMLHVWIIEPKDGEDKPSREVMAKTLGMLESDPALEALFCFDHWSNDLMCLAPDFGLAFKAAEWAFNAGQQVEIVEPAKLFVPPPRPSPNHYWGLDEAAWLELPEIEEDQDASSAE